MSCVGNLACIAKQRFDFMCSQNCRDSRATSTVYKMYIAIGIYILESGFRDDCTLQGQGDALEVHLLRLFIICVDINHRKLSRTCTYMQAWFSTLFIQNAHCKLISLFFLAPNQHLVIICDNMNMNHASKIHVNALCCSLIRTRKTVFAPST